MPTRPSSTVKQQQIFELPGSHETMNPSILYDTYVSRAAALKVGDMEVAAQSRLDRLGQLAFADARAFELTACAGTLRGMVLGTVVVDRG